MSRVGKKPIPLPKGVKIQIGEQLGSDQDPKGTLMVPIPAGVHFKQTDGRLEVVRDGDEYSALHGLTRALAANAVQGVSTGFTQGTRYRGHRLSRRREGQSRHLHAGVFASLSKLLLPDGVDLKIDKQTHLVLSGHDKQLVGQVAANIRALRKPDPYKNKGVRYTGEPLRKKVGKTGASAK
jgi:large subunit ribosomal protein L6